jgi:hypothetical protein
MVTATEAAYVEEVSRADARWVSSHFLYDVHRKRGREDGDVIDGLGDVPSDAQKLRLVEDRKPKRWTPEEDEVLRVAVEKHGQRNWKVRFFWLFVYKARAALD